MVDNPPPVPFSLPMPPERMVWCVEVIGWTMREVARQAEIHENTVRQMARGKRFIPDKMAYWLEYLAAFHLACPKPFGWDTPKRRPGEENHEENSAEDEMPLDGRWPRPARAARNS